MLAWVRMHRGFSRLVRTSTILSEMLTSALFLLWLLLIIFYRQPESVGAFLTERALNIPPLKHGSDYDYDYRKARRKDLRVGTNNLALGESPKPHTAP